MFVFYFIVYSFMGWLLENSYSFFTNRLFFKPNFLRGPFKPIYGFAPVLLVYFLPPGVHWTMVLLLCFVIPTLVEYLTGALLQKFFHRQWWDYSDNPMQLHGHICLYFCICWTLLSVICIKFIHPVIASVYRAIEPYWSWMWQAVIVYFVVEMLLAIRRHSLQALTEAKPEDTMEYSK